MSANRIITAEEAEAAGNVQASDGEFYRDRADDKLEWVVRNAKTPADKRAAAQTILDYREQLREADQRAADGEQPAAQSKPAPAPAPTPPAQQVVKPAPKATPQQPAPKAGVAYPNTSPH